MKKSMVLMAILGVWSTSALAAGFQCWDGTFAYRYFRVIPTADKVTVEMEGQYFGNMINGEMFGLGKNEKIEVISIDLPKSACRFSAEDSRIVSCFFNPGSGAPAPARLKVRQIDPWETKEISTQIASTVVFETAAVRQLQPWSGNQLVKARSATLEIVGSDMDNGIFTQITSHPSDNPDKHYCRDL